MSKSIRLLSKPENLALANIFDVVDERYLEAIDLRSHFDDEAASKDGALTQRLLDEARASDVALCLKFYLYELRTPLCTDIFLSCFVDADAIDDERERLDCICSIVRMLPPSNFTLLRAIVAYFRRYIKEGAGDIEYVCDKFAPLLLWQSDDEENGESADAELRRPSDDSIVVVVVNNALQLAQLCLVEPTWSITQALRSIILQVRRVAVVFCFFVTTLFAR